MATQPNSFQFDDDVVWEVIEAFSNTLATSAYAIPFNEFDGNPKNGTSYRLNYPILQRAVDGIAYDPANMQNIFRRFRRINLNDGFNVTFPITWDEITFKSGTMNQQAFSSEYLVPAARSLGEKCNKATMTEMAINFSDTIGDSTQPLNGITTMANIDSMFSNMGLSHFAKKYFQLSPNSTAGLQTPYAGYFNQGFNTSILEKDTTTFNKMYSGIWPYVDQSYIRIQNGVFDTGAAGDITVTVAPPTTQTINDSYSVITLSGFANNQANVLRALNRIYFTHTNGDIVQQINPDNYTSFGNYKTFVVLGDNATPSNPIVNAVTDDATIRVFPPIVSAATDQYANVSSPVVVGDIVNIVGAASTLTVTSYYVLNFCFVDQGLRFANPPIGTTVVGSGNMGFGGFAYQQKMSEKIPNSEMTLALNVSCDGNHPAFSNVISSRAVSGSAAFNGYGFGVLSNM
jgi:hypothetical protein